MGAIDSKYEAERASITEKNIETMASRGVALLLTANSTPRPARQVLNMAIAAMMNGFGMRGVMINSFFMNPSFFPKQIGEKNGSLTGFQCSERIIRF